MRVQLGSTWCSHTLCIRNQLVNVVFAEFYLQIKTHKYVAIQCNFVMITQDLIQALCKTLEHFGFSPLNSQKWTLCSLRSPSSVSTFSLVLFSSQQHHSFTKQLRADLKNIQLFFFSRFCSTLKAPYCFQEYLEKNKEPPLGFVPNGNG